MKKYFLSFLVLGVMSVGAGCSPAAMPPDVSEKDAAPVAPVATTTQKDLPPSAVDFVAEPVVPVEKMPVPQKNENSDAMDGARYRADWFAIRYPKNFAASPTAPSVSYGGEKIITTDEARFTSPDGAVEFYVYSPLWSGEPKYLMAGPGETMVDQKTQESGTGMSKKVLRWVTFHSDSPAYYRSYVSIREQVGSGSELHHVFGIRYADEAVYNEYKNAFAAFKNSLQQFAD